MLISGSLNQSFSIGGPSETLCVEYSYLVDQFVEGTEHYAVEVGSLDSAVQFIEDRVNLSILDANIGM
jgi:hypothetical protein